ncbi:MAG: HupE/UreJ family protein [Gammaproteobacteria bacterium]|nr:HupE/UreJ family protein [Gammaproteobacteria bacterium]
MQYIAIRLLILGLLLSPPLAADVVRPALIEISVYTSGQISIEIRASVEALLTGINGRYRNTQEAPNAEEYDRYRVMQSDELKQAFESFHASLLAGVDLKLDGQTEALSIHSVDIPEPGYTKVPRISVITLQAQASREKQHLTWYYPMRFGDHATRVRQVDEDNELWHWSDHQWIKQDVYTEPYPLDEIFTRQSLWQVAKTYTVSGFQHIIPLGMDHILFVLGIFLLSTSWKPLLWQVTMFTLAHSITLSLSMLELFSLPARIVEPLIALSIAYVAIENIFTPGLHRSRLWIVFAFGLLHGLGFASILAEFGMPRDDFALALISFNLGIEFGQLAILVIAYLLFAIWFKNQQRYRHWVIIPLSTLIALTGLYWFWDRLEWVA